MDIDHSYSYSDATGSVYYQSYIEKCLGEDDEKFTVRYGNTYRGIDPRECKNIYAPQITSITNKDLFDRFLTALILSLIVCLANIGLALFGFLLFRTPSDF